jgi:hypothetical protein
VADGMCQRKSKMISETMLNRLEPMIWPTSPNRNGPTMPANLDETS